MANYYVFSISGGDPWVDTYSKSELLKWIAEFTDDDHDGKLPEFAPEPVSPDMWELGDSYLIIKGQIVTPKPEEKVVECSVD